MPYYGESKCSAIVKSTGLPCKNGGYYLLDDKILCGVHCEDKSKILPKNPNAKQEKLDNLSSHEDTVKKATLQNKRESKKGDIILYKMGMRAAVVVKEGYQAVFPNFKHANRKDGYGCAQLSPKSLGPVKHGQPGLPECQNLENFHQGNKVYRSEIQAETERGLGDPLPIFYERQLEMYNDAFPWRHKYEKYPDANIGKEVAYSLWITKDKKKLKLSYFESRKIYCVQYEHLILHNPKSLQEFNHLRSLVENGTNIQICGYDAYPVNRIGAAGSNAYDAYTVHKDGVSADNNVDVDGNFTLEQAVKLYKDITKPFGHELVLFCLLHKVKPWETCDIEGLDNIVAS